MTTTGRPIPTPDEASAPFFKAAKEGTLLLKYCPNCERYFGPERDICDICFNYQLEWRPSAGKGEVYTFIIMHQITNPAFANEVPYNVLTVELDEGPRIKSNMVGIPDSEIKVGQRVEAVFEDVNDEVAIPHFKPSA